MSVSVNIGPDALSDERIAKMSDATGWDEFAVIGFLCRFWVATLNSHISTMAPDLLYALVRQICDDPVLPAALITSGYVMPGKGGLEIVGNAAILQISKKRRAAGSARGRAAAAKRLSAARPTLQLAPPPPVKKRVRKKAEPKTLTEFEQAKKATWEAYDAAIRQRYPDAEPPRNARANGMVANFVKRVGRDCAPAVIEFFVKHHDPVYIKRMHELGMAVKDAEILLVQYQRKRAESQDELAANSGSDALIRQLNRL